MKKVSVITTCYNAEQYVSYAVGSVLLQQINDDLEVEYIIVNDCSTDRSLDVINKLIELHPNKDKIKCVIYDLKENLGCGGARKYGIEHATGDYFMFLDADDYYIKPDFISRAVKDLESNDADIVEYGVKFGSTNTSVINGESIELNTEEEKLTALFQNNYIRFNIWTKIYRRKVVESYPYSAERTYEDVRTIPIWVANAGKIVIKPTIEINYREVNTSIIRENDIATRVGTITAIASLFEKFKHNKNILKCMYIRSMIDLEIILNNHTSMDKGFNKLSKLNTYMLSYLYPDKYKEMTFNIEDLEQTEKE